MKTKVGELWRRAAEFLKQTQIRTMIVLVVLLGVSLAAYGIFLTQKAQVVVLTAPITHQPTYLGNPVFILGSGNVVQNGTAYSYVRINASAITKGDVFTALPTLNVGLKGVGIDDDNFTSGITFTGSAYGTFPYWLNFTMSLPQLNMNASFVAARDCK